MMRHAKCAFGLVFALGLVTAPALAADNPELSALFYPRDGTEPQPKSLRIGRIELNVDIVGGAAKTQAVVRFENPERDDPLEGDFVLDLPKGSVVTGYALDVDGRMVDGVLVSQRKGVIAYQAKVRRGLDPGLAEVTRTNAFRTHVFPILPEKGRTIKVEFVTPLVSGQKFVLPLVTSETVGEFSIHLTTSGQESPPRLKAPEGIELLWTPSPAGFDARASSAEQSLSGALEITPAGKSKAISLSRHRNGEAFFEINDTAPKAGAPIPEPKHVRIYWDHSLSRRHDDLNSEAALVSRYLASVTPGIVDLVLFSDKGPELRTFEAPQIGAQVDAVLKTIDYRGATSLEGVLTAGLPMADVCLYVSDGNVTIDPYAVERLRCTLFTISSAAEANHGFLASLAKQSAGAHLDLTALTIDEALARMAPNSPHVANVTSTDGRNLDYEALPGEEGRFRVVGPLPAFGDIVVNLAGGKFKTYAVNRARVSAHDGIAALWAAGRAGELLAKDKPDADAILALARRYSVTVPQTVFVVLENGYDYAEAGIEPPPSLGATELQNYRETRADLEREKKKQVAERLPTVIAAWEELKAWWNIDFSKLPHPPRMRRDMAEEIPEAVLITGSLIRAPVGGNPDITVEVEPWSPNRPYITALAAADATSFDAVLRQQEIDYGMLPAFYLDVAEFLFRRGQSAQAAAEVMNALDLPATNSATLMILAERLMQYGDERRALWLYERVLQLQPDLPQPRRNLALALMKRADHQKDRAAKRRDYVRSLNLLTEIVTKTWDPAYDGIELIALMEANRIVPRLSQLGITRTSLDPRLVAFIDVDLRVILEWNTDIVDMDLWVDEPNGERAIYSNPKTEIGGRLSNDMTAGYGPEEYLLHHAVPGTYTVRVNVYATDRLNPNGAIRVRAHLYRGYNRANEQEQSFEVELQPSTDLEHGESTELVGRFTVGDGMQMASRPE